MSNKKETTAQTSFDPQQMSRYQSWMGQLMPFLRSMMLNPTKTPFFNQQLQQSTKGASQLAGRAGSNALLNWQRSGLGNMAGGGGMFQQLMRGVGRMGSNLQYQGWNNAMNNAQGNLWNAASLGTSAFQPLVTGGTQTQTTSGLGTWLPQAIAAGVGVAAAPFTGGMSLGPAFSQMGHMGQAPGATSGMGDFSPFQPSSWSGSGSTLIPSPSLAQFSELPTGSAPSTSFSPWG